MSANAGRVTTHEEYNLCSSKTRISLYIDLLARLASCETPKPYTSSPYSTRRGEDHSAWQTRRRRCRSGDCVTMSGLCTHETRRRVPSAPAGYTLDRLDDGRGDLLDDYSNTTPSGETPTGTATTFSVLPPHRTRACTDTRYRTFQDSGSLLNTLFDRFDGRTEVV